MLDQTPDNEANGLAATKRILVAAVVYAGVMVMMPTSAAANIYVYRTRDGGELVTSERRPGLELLRVIEGSEPSSGSSSDQSSSTEETSESAKAAAARRRAEQARREAEKNGELEPTNIGRTAAYDDLIEEASEAYDVPFSFIKAVIRVESNFRRFATSHAGAMGLMQLMPATADSLSVTDPFDPRQNVYGGTKLLRQLIDRYNGDINLVLSAYNAGGAAVARYDGIPYAQTREYVASVVKWYRHYKQQREGQ